VTNIANLRIGQIVGLRIERYLRFFKDHFRAFATDTVDIGQRNIHALAPGQIDTSNACHVLAPFLKPLGGVIPAVAYGGGFHK
jgi:hypothetical protein